MATRNRAQACQNTIKRGGKKNRRSILVVGVGVTSEPARLCADIRGCVLVYLSVHTHRGCVYIDIGPLCGIAKMLFSRRIMAIIVTKWSVIVGKKVPVTIEDDAPGKWQMHGARLTASPVSSFACSAGAASFTRSFIFFHSNVHFLRIFHIDG